MTPPEEFQFLFRKEGVSPESAVESRYALADLIARPVVRDEHRGRYLVFASREEFLAWAPGVPEAERCFHEVVFGRLPQRLKFDVDAPAHKLGAAPPGEAPPGAAAAHAAVDQLIEAILDELHDTYCGIEDILPVREGLVVTDSSGPTPGGYKHSYHVVVLH